MIQLTDLRTGVRLETGIPELGTPGRDRLKTMLQNCLTRLWGDLPEVFLRKEHEIRLEPAESDGLLMVSATDRRVFVRLGAAADLAIDGTLSARWLDVERDGRVYRRRIQEVYDDVVDGTPRSHIVVDEPWDNLTDAGLAYRIHTYEYPLPADTQAVRSVLIARESYPSTDDLQPLQPEELERMRLSRGWKASGRPNYYARGDFAQLPAPHFTPSVALTTVQGNAGRWGFDSIGIERGAAYALGQQYGAGGTFSYRSVLVHGRQRFQNPLADGALAPFLVSPPTPASPKITTTWGGQFVIVTSPDEDYVRGFGDNPLLPSYHRSGIEKWWFRARHATQDPNAAGNNAAVPQLESDGVFYLWRITRGYITTTNDRGDDDPVDRHYPLRDFGGHHTIRFDATPADEYRCLVNTVRRTPVIADDADAINVPPEFSDCLVQLVAAQIARRDKDFKAMQHHEKLYRERLTSLRAGQSLARIAAGGFGNGLGPARSSPSTNWTIRST